ncbi:MAG: outer membrane homotrimeric porin [Desulfovibrionaceae bacterium]|nr:outer membrane homotrimeric porin [Desulfovibrionaceae bacterium]
MKKLGTIAAVGALAALFATPAQAIDFTAKGHWWMGFTAWQNNFTEKTRSGDETRRTSSKDKFEALQRFRVQIEARASENLSGMLQFQIGNQRWGNAGTGGALGADGQVIKVRWAYMDWAVPEADLKVRMGMQPIALPNRAGGPAVLDSRSAAVVASLPLTENIGVTAMWLRPSNDNYTDNAGSQSNYLDNMDLFGLTVPMKFEGFEVEPWALYGMIGKNTFAGGSHWNDGSSSFSLNPYHGTSGNEAEVSRTGKAYGSCFWAGIPLAITYWDPLNIEFDFNYGYVESMGRYTAFKGLDQTAVRGTTERQGWLAKALVEYKTDWGTPGIFGWYGSGDDGSIKNGSERMPVLAPYGTFTSFLGDGGLAWAWQDCMVSYSGTWGLGLQIKDMSFLENLSHTVRATWWGGTNSPSMVKYMEEAYAWDYGSYNTDGPYMTTNDALLEFNLSTNYKMYDNFDINLELGYIVNFMDNDTWKDAGTRNTSFSKQDAWKIQLAFMYNF